MTFLQRFTQETKGIENLSSGPCCNCKECQSLYGMDTSELDNQLDNGMAIEPHFSWQACDTCGAIAGDRYETHGFVDGNLEHFSSCPDCICYLDSGYLPTEPSGV